MEYLVTMTTHVPDETSDQAVADVRAREAAQSSELATQGICCGWRLPGQSRALGLWRARDPAEPQAILQSLPLDAWMTVETTPLTPHPNDPALKTL
jgi:muconolactone delta-isomerase